MSGEEAVADRLIEAALAVAEERGWQALSLVDVARRAEVPLVDCYRAFPDKARLVYRLLAVTDQAVLRDGLAAGEDSPRDRLFDVFMRRFDALQQRRAGTVAILRELAYDPLTAAGLLPRLARSIVWMGEAAGLEMTGLPGVLRVKTLGAVYLYTLRAWINDDTTDMAQTMAALDKALRRADRLLSALPGAMSSTLPPQPAPSPRPAPSSPPSA
jgi:AcrR family transcriptional regulator